MELNPILIVDDDEDDLEMVKEALKSLDVHRPIHFFRSGLELIEHLQASGKAPFFILCDLNLAGETGFEIRKKITEDPALRYKSVPFIFWSTNASEKQIQYAYDLPAQGFFFKPDSFDALCSTFNTILNYWQKASIQSRFNSPLKRQ